MHLLERWCPRQSLLHHFCRRALPSASRLGSQSKGHLTKPHQLPCHRPAKHIHISSPRATASHITPIEQLNSPPLARLLQNPRSILVGQVVIKVYSSGQPEQRQPVRLGQTKLNAYKHVAVEALFVPVCLVLPTYSSPKGKDSDRTITGHG
jgi:hypothetical protein